MTVVFGFGDRLIGLFLLSLIPLKFLPFPLFAAFFISLFGIWICLQHLDKKYWKNLGIPGPKPHIILGNILNISRKGVIEYDKENLAKYGKSYGDYTLGRHEFVTMEREKLRRIFVKDFSNFPQRFNLMGSIDDSELKEKSFERNNLATIVGEDWKRVRNVVSPAFTTGKLKKLIPILSECTNRMGDFIEREYILRGKELPLKELFGRLVLDEIGRAGFSADLDMFKDRKEGEKNAFEENTRKVLERLGFQRFIAFFPFVFYLLNKFFNGEFNSLRFFFDLMNNLYEERKNDERANEKYNDIFQLLMNTLNEEEEGGMKQNAEDSEIIHNVLDWKSSKYLSRMELFAQSFVLLVAGYDTTASVLHFAFYMLAMDIEIQEKLREEILDILGDEKEITHDHLKGMHYLQAVIKETLRFYSPAMRTNRECMEDIDLDGVPLKKGDIVSIPIAAIHFNEEFYSEPEKFRPERFMPDQKASIDPLTFLPFGFGPRNCIGMRFAEFQMQMALAILLRRFQFKPGPNTPELPLRLVATMLLKPVKPIFVLAEKI